MLGYWRPSGFALRASLYAVTGRPPGYAVTKAGGGLPAPQEAGTI